MAADTSKALPPTNTLPSNPRGIPPFPFMSSVDDYCKTLADVSPTLNRFQEMINKYQFMEANVQQRAASLRDKLPEMRSTLATVRFLRRQRENTGNTQEGEGEIDGDGDGESDGEKGNMKPLDTTFPLSDTLYARAHIHPASTSDVYLWLGANVMVAYPLAEAEELLDEKRRKARQSLGECEEDLEFLRVQITTLEVATARVYNWDVGEKRRLRAKGESVPGDGEEKT